MTRTKKIFACAVSGMMILFFFQSAHAGLATVAKTKESLTLQSPAMDAIGTGSAGSYNHGTGKSEGSGKKSYSYGKSHHKSDHSNKGYSKGGHSKHHYAKSGHKSYGKHSGHSAHSSKCFFSHLLNFRHKLKLSETQVEDIQKMRFDYKKTKVMLVAEKEVAKMEFDQLVHGKTVDESAIRAAGEKIITAKTKKIRAKVEAKIALMKLLTDEQRSMVQKMHASH